MMRPVILSRPENSADALTIFCDGGSLTTSSPGCVVESPPGGRGRCCGGAWGMRGLGSIAAVPGGGKGRDCTGPGKGDCCCGGAPGGRPPGGGPPCGTPGTPDGGRGG